MNRSFYDKIKNTAVLIIICAMVCSPIRVYGEVAPIEQAQEKLTDISEEEKKVLKDLFALTQEMDVLEQKEAEMNEQIKTLRGQLLLLEDDIQDKQDTYDKKLHVLKEVLIYYQRGGPATYLEILLSTDSVSSFIMSINLIRDISRNTGELLNTLEEEKKCLQKQKQELKEKSTQLTQQKAELKQTLKSKEAVIAEKESYLSSLKEERIYYEDQMDSLNLVWKDCKTLFSDMVTEINRVVGEGYFTAQDLNLELSFSGTKGALEQDTFNSVINEYTDLPETRFLFEEGEVIIEVPEKQLILYGNFVIAQDKAIRYEVSSGTFYGLPLKEESIQELFANGPLLIDFSSISGDMVLFDFALQKVESIDGRLTFEIELQW